MTDRGAAARRYHEATKHSPRSVSESTHGLDWANQPLPFKVYTKLEPIRLPTEIVPSAQPALRSILGADGELGRSAIPDLAEVARLCVLSNGVTRVRRFPGGDLAFRAAGTTGALYHVELYLAWADLADLPAGLYHFGAHDNALRRLRDGDQRASLVESSGGDEALAAAPLIVVATSTFWRNAWKYQARAWRHSFWDTGTVLANLLSLAAGSGLPARVVLGFADARVNALLDVDAEREAAVCLVGIGRGGASPPPVAPDTPPLNLETVRLSPREVRYPLIEETQAATSLGSPGEAASWRGRAGVIAPTGHSRRERPLPPSGIAPTDESRREPPLAPSITAPTDERPRDWPGAAPDEPIEVVIRRRGSTRRFARQPIPRSTLTTLLAAAGTPIPADFAPDGVALTEPFAIVNAVDGMGPGTYRWSGGAGEPELLRGGDFRSEAGFLALGQELGADASVNLYWLADLDRLLERLGDRGYRAAQLDAAIRAGRAWLAAYAIGLGATGLTFFDDEVARFFGQPPERTGVMFLLAAGRPARPARL